MANIIYNQNNDTLITGTTGNDDIHNYGMNVTISASEGKDYIYNYSGSLVMIDAGDGDDRIYNSVTSVAIDAGAGNDHIYNYSGDHVTIALGAGDDYIYSYGSSVLIDAGEGNDEISNANGESTTISAGEGDDSIANGGSSVSINASVGDDYIDNGGSNVSIFAGDGADTISNQNEGSNVIIDAGIGNDSVTNWGSSVTIDTGVGDDYIYSDGYSVLINAGAGDDIVSLNTYPYMYHIYIIENTITGGLGNDTIYFERASNFFQIFIYNSGDGNDVIYNVTKYDTISIEGASYTRSTAGSDLILNMTGGGAMTLFGAANTDVNIKGTESENDSDTQIGGSDTIDGGSSSANTLDNVIIIGTENPDVLNNTGNNVWIKGLGGDDFLANASSITIGSGFKSGDNVTLEGGRGNDAISCRSTDHIVYAAGDGIDTVSVLDSSATNPTIHITSGSFSGAVLLNATVFIKINDGGVKIQGSYDKPVKVIDSKGHEISFTLNIENASYEAKPFERTVAAGGSVTAEYHGEIDGVYYYAEKVTGNNGSVILEEGDTLTKDSSGNITEVKISDKNRTLTTNISALADKTLLVKAPDSSSIANVAGETKIYWNENGRVVVEAVDKTKSVFVYAHADNLDVIGSNKADRITTNGQNSYIDSRLGNDTLNSAGTGATILGGKDNDTISGNFDVFKLETATVKKAEKIGSDLIVTIGSSFIQGTSEHVLTFKNSADKTISIVNDRNATLSISDGYPGDPQILRDDVAYIQTRLEQNRANLCNKTAEYIGYDPEAPEDKITVDEIKSGLYVTSPADGSFNLNSLPDAVYSKIAEKIAQTANKSQITSYSATDTNQWLANAFNVISGLGEITDTVKVGSTTYKITINSLIAAGTGSAGITIVHGGNTVAMSWIASDDRTSKVLDNYLKTLAELHENVWWNVINGLITDVAGKKAAKYADYVKSIVTALVDSEEDDVVGAIKEIALNEFQEYLSSTDTSWLGTFLENTLPNHKGVYIVDAAKSFKSLTKKALDINSYIDQVNNLGSAAASGDLGAVYENFLDSYNAFVENETEVINNLNGTTTFLDDIKNDIRNIKNDFNLFKLSAGTSTSTASVVAGAAANPLAVGSTVYFDDEGDLIHSDTNAVLSLKMDGGKIFYTAMTSDNQEVSLGSSNDNFDIVLTTQTGDDKITIASSASVTINSDAGNDTIKNSSGNSVINSGTGNDVVDNIGDNVLLNCGEGNDSTWGGGDKITIHGGSGDDRLEIWGTNSIVNVDEGNNQVFVHGNNVTINGGNGADTIENWDDRSGYPLKNPGYAKIFAGAGADFVRHFGSFATISSGKGNDTIQSVHGLTYNGTSSNLYLYENGDGNDTILGYDSSDTVSITGATYSTSTVGSNVLVSITGSGTITLNDAKNKTINIKGTLKSGDDGISINGAVLTVSTIFSGNKIDLATYATTVTKVNASALSRGISIVGTAAANSLKGGKGADTIFGGAGNDTISLGGGADVYVYSSGNDLIQDYTTGDDKIKLSGTSITSASVSGSNVVLKTSTGNLTVKNGKGNNIIIVDAAGNETSQIYPSVAHEPTLSSDLTYDAKKTAVTLASSFSDTLKAADYASTVKKIDASKISKAINIFGNAQANTILGSSKADTIYGGTGNDSISGGVGNDKLYGDAGADTLYGGAGADTLTGGDGKDVFVYSNGDGADVIADFTTGQDSIQLTSGTVSSALLKGSDMVFKIGSGSLTVKNGKGKEISVGSTIYYNNFVYDTKKTAVTLASGFSGSLKVADYASTVKKIDASDVSKSVNLVGNSQANTIIGGSKAETIYGGTGNDSINGGAGNDKLYGDAGNDKLLGGDGADTLFGGAGADTLTGGDGKDVFVYANGDGADVITDFTAGQDSIKLTSGTVASASLTGSDMVLKIGSGSLTVKNGKGKEISVGSAIYFNNFVYDAKKTAVTLASVFTGSLKAADYSSTVKKIDASAVSKSVNLVGNAQANTIIGSSKAETIYGGKGNDSINGGADNDKLYGEAGNDTLWGGTGNDIFVYGSGEGKDVIADYAAGDTIKISNGTITATGYKSNDVVFTVGSGTLTVKNGKGKAITITDAGNKTSTKTYMTGVVYGTNAAAGRNSNTLWFTEDDTNFLGETNLDAISTEKYSLIDVETAANASDLVQNDSLSNSALTFSAK